MEIEVGDYIRTKIGRIYTVKNIKTFEDGDVHIYNENYIYYRISDIAKHSKNIIDLIEVGDIIEVINRGENKEDAIKVELFDEAGFYDEMIKQIKRKESRVLSILTHEQYGQNCFKMEGE